jgi:hypothetical protein
VSAAVNGQKITRVLTGLAVLAVAVVAGYVSYGHIESLGLAHGYGIDAARLLPISVDGLIVASSMALLSGSAPWLARAGLALGILATLAANIEAGARFGIVGALASAWPAVAFIVASEILLKMIRGAGDVPSAVRATETVAPATYTAPESTPEAVSDAVPEVVPVDVPEIEPAADTASTVLPRTVPARAPRRAPARPKSPGRMFAAELASGTLPSLREVKRRAGCGTPRAKAILTELESLIAQAEEVAAAA